MDKLMELFGTELGPVAAVGFVLLGYLVITIDRGRLTSPSKDDTQIGLKLVLYGLLLEGVQLAAQGVAMFVGFALGGFKGGGGVAKVSIPPIIVGGLVVLAVAKALLPRTNTAAYRQCERFMLGALAIQFGVMAIVSVDHMLTGLFTDDEWTRTARALAATGVDGVIAFVAITRFGAIAGWTMPVPPPPPPPQQFPPQGFPPPGGGYPPPGGGYPPPQGGGYPPPQGGGNPYAPR